MIPNQILLIDNYAITSIYLGYSTRPPASYHESQSSCKLGSGFTKIEPINPQKAAIAFFTTIISGEG